MSRRRSLGPRGLRAFEPSLIAEDPDAPSGTWGHWVVWNIPAMARGLPEGLPGRAELEDGTRQGITDFGWAGYGEPCPPSGAHRYFFRLYALDTTLELPSTTRKADLERAMRGHIVSETALVGIYRHRP